MGAVECFFRLFTLLNPVKMLTIIHYVICRSPTPEIANGEWMPYPHNLAITLEPQYVAPLTPERAYFWRSLYYKYGAEIEREN